MIIKFAARHGRAGASWHQPLLRRSVQQQHRLFFNDFKNRGKVDEPKERIKGQLPEPPKAFYWTWLSALYRHAFYNPFFRNTKDKLLRFFTSFQKTKEQREREKMGYFGRFVHDKKQWFTEKSQGTFEFYNPFSRKRSYIKRTLLYYGSLVLGFFLFLKSFPLILSNLISGPKNP